VPLLSSYRTEWTVLRERRHNVLIEGSVRATAAVLLLLQPHIHEPIVTALPGTPLSLPPSDTRTLILRDAAALSSDEQRRLLEWLGGMASRVQLISSAERPLFELVADGRFEPALYYRMNIILLRLVPQNLNRLI
jgi:hypothetical protein